MDGLVLKPVPLIVMSTAEFVAVGVGGEKLVIASGAGTPVVLKLASSIAWFCRLNGRGLVVPDRP